VLRRFLFICVVFAYTFMLRSQVVFCPPGAKWTYAFVNIPQWGPNPSYYLDNVNYLKDSILSPDTLKLLSHQYYYSSCYNDAGTQAKYTLIKQKGDTIFFKNAKTQNQWQILINFACQPGSGWNTTVVNYAGSPMNYSYVVNSVSIVNINGLALKRLHTTRGEFTERLGINGFMFPFLSYGGGCDGYWYSHFVCYSDLASGEFNFLGVGCNTTGFDEVSLEQNNPFFQIFPNPAGETVDVKALYPNTSLPLKILIYDIFGKCVLTTKAEGDTEISLIHLNKGFYSLRVFENEKQVFTQKLIKE
jgi:hypothetical protein